MIFWCVLQLKKVEINFTLPKILLCKDYLLIQAVLSKGSFKYIYQIKQFIDLLISILTSGVKSQAGYLVLNIESVISLCVNMYLNSMQLHVLIATLISNA